MNTQTGTPAVPAKAVTTLFEFTHSVFRKNVADITHEESLRVPEPAGNCMNWVGGHIVATRDGMLEMLGKKPRLTESERQRYQRGSNALENAADALAWERILSELDASQASLREAFAGLTTEQLAAPLPANRNPFGVDSVGEQIALFSFHESYHVGQLGILRRVCGKPGAIK